MCDQRVIQFKAVTVNGAHDVNTIRTSDFE
jgi:hypothetical protein